MSGDLRRTHVVISAPSQWGQQACDHLLHRAVADGGRVTLIVPRRDKERFEKNAPGIKEWQHDPSLKACLERLRTSGRPVDYLYDDQVNHLAATLISQRESGSHLTVGYVTSSAEDHLNHARYLAQFCERVLVEKPVSRIFSEIEPDGGFSSLVHQAAAEQKCLLTTAEHYLFRPGVTSALRSDLLKQFFERHQRCDLYYEFHFTEPAGRDDPTERLSSYQDGSILDVLAPHGLGPVACLLVPMLGLRPARVDFDEHLTWHLVRSWQATEANGSLKVSVLAETAAELRGRLRLPDSRQVHVRLRSAKGLGAGLRYFKFSCPIAGCRHLGEKRDQVRNDLGARSGVKDDDRLYFGVSLGSAGFTVLDYVSPSAQLFEERDGGYQSDTRGSNSEAANAQAAMLDAFLGDELEEPGRFVPVQTACQLVRSGIRAQGRAFNSKPGEYVWGTEPKDWQTGGEDEPNEMELKPLGHLPVGIAQLKEVLGVPQQDSSTSGPYHRVVTILGAEGAGNSDIARALSGVLPALLINIPRDEAWDRQQPESSSAESSSPSKFTLETVLRDLATQLQLPMTTARRPAEELLAYLRQAGKHLSGADILLFNGVDRLPPPDWHVLVRILNHLPTKYRMIFVTKRWDRAAGFVVRTEELIDALSSSAEIQRLKEPPLEAYFPPELQQKEEISRRYRQLWEEVLLPFSKKNLTVQQQIASYVFYVALPAALQKRGIQWQQNAWWDLDPEELNWHDLSELVQADIASLDLPTPLVAYPEAFLDRVSLLCLAMVGEEDRSAIRSLAAFSGSIRRELIEEVRPDLFARLNEFQPVRALFEKVEKDQALLFPRVRRAALTCQPEQLAQLRAEIERRRLILALRRLSSSSPGRHRLVEEMIRLLYGASLESLNLDQSPFEICCMELIAGLETSSDLRGDQAAGSLIELLTDSASLRKTNLGLLARARLTRLKGWLLCSAAGTDPALLHQATEVLVHAHALAQYCKHRKGRSREQERQGRESLVLTIQGVVFAGLVQNRCWHHLLEVGKTPWVPRPDWEKFVAPDQAQYEHSLWNLCGLHPSAEFLEASSGLSKRVLAVAVRLLALYTAVRQRNFSPGRPAKLCLIAAQLNEGEEDCRARDLLEAALMLSDEQPIADPWELAEGESLTRGFLHTKAREIFAKERPAHLGLAPYMDLLDRIVEGRRNKVLLPTLEDMARFEVEFERTGEVYFTELVQDMKTLRQG